MCSRQCRGQPGLLSCQPCCSPYDCGRRGGRKCLPQCESGTAHVATLMRAPRGPEGSNRRHVAVCRTADAPGCYSYRVSLAHSARIGSLCARRVMAPRHASHQENATMAPSDPKQQVPPRTKLPAILRRLNPCNSSGLFPQLSPIPLHLTGKISRFLISRRGQPSSKP